MYHHAHNFGGVLRNGSLDELLKTNMLFLYVGMLGGTRGVVVGITPRCRDVLWPWAAVPN
jgi:hypothetical protein